MAPLDLLKPLYTPGPWLTNGTLIHIRQMSLTVATVHLPRVGHAPRTEGEARANIALIAAAPDLVVVARQCQRVLHDLTRGPNTLSVQHIFAQAVEAETRARTALERVLRG